MRKSSGPALSERSESKGLTVLEVIVAMAIATVIGGLLLTVILNSAGVFYSQGSKVEQGLNINDALSKVRLVIKESSAVEAGYPSVNPTYTSGEEQLVLKLLSQDNLENIIPDTFDYYVFFKDQSRLRLKSFPNNQSSVKAADQILAGNVDMVRFDYLDSSGQAVTPVSAVKVKITLSLQQKAGSYFEANIATSEANLRND